MIEQLETLPHINAMLRLPYITHGHVIKNKEGIRARCGGPKLCQECEKEQLILDLLCEIHDRAPRNDDHLPVPDVTKLTVRLAEQHQT